VVDDGSADTDVPSLFQGTDIVVLRHAHNLGKGEALRTGLRHVREQGGEFGTTTGRARRIGWFDAVVVRKSTRLNGLDALAITHLDVLSKFDEIPLCVAYECEGERTVDFPNDLGRLAKCRPVYETLPGWKVDIAGARTYQDLPDNAQRYVRRIEELVEAPLSHLLVGRQRDQSILL
jgi:adenylosuccinate synthase